MNEEFTPQVPPALPAGQPQKRILALSVVGDMVHRMSIPALNWMIENGDDVLFQKARKTRDNWEQEQHWFIAWGNETRFFELAEMAVRDLTKFKEAMRVIPSEGPEQQRIVELALLTGKEFHKPIGGFKQSGQKRHSRGKRR